MPTDSTTCRVCSNQTSSVTVGEGDWLSVKCPRCGKFSITGTAAEDWRDRPPSTRQIANAAGWIREHQGIQITSDYLSTLFSLSSPTVASRADKLLLYIRKRHPGIGIKIRFGENSTNPAEAIGASWSDDHDEFVYLLREYLYASKEFLALTPPNIYTITPEGHAYLDELQHSRVASNIGFCAMWFDESVKHIWTASIEPAIRDAGYDPKRIDTHEHNNRIDDEIIAMIRRSKFVVADFTGQRGGVYFESGLALGLGLQVVWTCSKEELDADKIHFDNRQYSFVTWEPDKLDDFKVRLQNRIEATLGRGPLVAS